MANFEVLDPAKHAEVKVEPGAAMSESHLVPVLATELGKAALHYPIVLVKNPDTGEFGLFALMGLRPGENLFFSADAGAAGGYLPLDLQRQPFLVVRGGSEGSGAIAIDLDHPKVGTSDGASIFAGDQPLILRVQPVLKAVMSGIAPTQALIAAALEHDLVKAGEIAVSDPAGAFTLRDFYTLDQQAMGALSGETLAALNAKGQLLALHLILASMGNVERLMSLRQQ